MAPWRIGRRRESQAPVVETERLILRLPRMTDHGQWAALRRDSAAFLRPWEPQWASDHLSRRAFRARVYWAERMRRERRALALVLIRRDDGVLVGALNMDNIRYAAARMAQVGYWIGAPYARRGYMGEALPALIGHAYEVLGLSRIEAGCLPANRPSRALLERCGFRYEGVAQRYLQINGRWCDHVLYAHLRADRRGKEHDESAKVRPWSEVS